jgi:hypothetical protein
VIMNESPVICPLLSIIPKATPASTETDTGDNSPNVDSHTDDQPKSSKFSMGNAICVKSQQILKRISLNLFQATCSLLLFCLLHSEFSTL